MILHNQPYQATKGFLLATVILLATAAISLAEPASEAHQAARCAGCHAGGAAAGLDPAAVAAQCTECHATHSLARRVATFHGNSAGRCLSCHSFHQPTTVTLASLTRQPPDFADIDGAACRSCHDERGSLASLSPAHRKAAELYHAQAGRRSQLSPSQTCLNCHSNTSSSPWQDETDGAVLAFNEHASHPFGITVTPGAGDSSNWIARRIDPRLHLFDGRLECQTCHLLTAGTDDLVVPFPTKYDLCKGCHKHYGDDKAGLVVVRVSR